MEEKYEQDKNLLESLMSKMKKKYPDLEAEIVDHELDEYSTSGLSLDLSGWDNGCGFLSMYVDRKVHYSVSKLVCDEIYRIEVMFVEGDADTVEYNEDKEMVRKEWKDEYARNFDEKFGSMIREQDLELIFTINDT